MADPIISVWPTPRAIVASGAPLAVSRQLSILAVGPSSPLLERTRARYLSLLTVATAAKLAPEQPALRTIFLNVTDSDERLHLGTCYNYSLAISKEHANITSCSVFGAAYALESLTQLGMSGSLPHNTIRIDDAPAYSWRGLMLDSGRRFAPVPVVKNLMDTMAAIKLNVLHLHASDHCRWAVESKLYPNLTSSLTGHMAGHYTQEDIKELVAYAHDRGIRVVPEFDVPGHARGLMPLEASGDVTFCTDRASRSQLYNTPDGKTYKTIEALVGEMASLFPDEVMHIGCDETAVTGRCSLSSTFDFERRLARAVGGARMGGKTAEGWEEILFDAGAALPTTIVNAWARHRPPEITKTGRHVVESYDSHFYFTSPAPGGPEGWSKVWYDISTGVPSNETQQLLGGEMSMWTDSYCYSDQCGATSSPITPVGAPLFPPSRDAEFGRSIGGMIWPRGFVGAGAFWRYNATADPRAEAFVQRIWKLNDHLARRGSLTCPSHCSCDQLTACGKPYIEDKDKDSQPQENDDAVVEAVAAAARVGDVEAARMAARPSCDASDALLLRRHATVCESLSLNGSSWCVHAAGVRAHHDWPNQAVYMHALLDALADPATCRNTSVARATVASLDRWQGNASVVGGFMWTWDVFQAQYYDTPRRPGVRIEAPDTLGRKCWAAAYLAQKWAAQRQALRRELNASGLQMAHWVDAYDAAIVSSDQLCRKVLANCFVNASYDKSRNGTCPGKALLFHELGFERENALRRFEVRYPYW